METGFFKAKSPIHSLNPSLKFIAFIVIIVMIFLPLGFFAQLIIGVLLMVIYFTSKLTLRRFWNIFKSVFFLFLILVIVNWIIYKAPIAIFVPANHFSIQIGQYVQGQANIPTVVGTLQNNVGDHSYVSNIWGGNVIGFLNPKDGFILNGTPISIDQIAAQNPSITNATNLFDSLSSSVKNQLLQLSGGDQSIASQYYWIINNGFVFNGNKYSIEILAHTNGGILNTQSAVIYKSYWYSLSPKALQLALYVAIKVLLMIISATILTNTTTSIELAYALEDILSPLKILRFPVVEASMMIAIALRFVPSLLSESQRILNAQSSRGVDFKNGAIKDKLKAMISLVVPLFNVAFLKSSELANAMEARSYNTRHARTRYRVFKLNFTDWLFFSILCLVTGFLIGILIKPLFFTPFGMFELGALFG